MHMPTCRPEIKDLVVDLHYSISAPETARAHTRAHTHTHTHPNTLTLFVVFPSR